MPFSCLFASMPSLPGPIGFSFFPINLLRCLLAHHVFLICMLLPCTLRPPSPSRAWDPNLRPEIHRQGAVGTTVLDVALESLALAYGFYRNPENSSLKFWQENRMKVGLRKGHLYFKDLLPKAPPAPPSSVTLLMVQRSRQYWKECRPLLSSLVVVVKA
jgi:hypothetical protein